MSQIIECPVDFIPVNENKVRFVALFVLVLSVVYLTLGLWHIFIFLIIDFALRAFDLGKYSLLALFSEGILKVAQIEPKPIDQAPKRFAARIGLIFSVVILGLHLSGFRDVAFGLGLILTVFAFLESFLGFCAGCLVYTYRKRFKLIA